MKRGERMLKSADRIQTYLCVLFLAIIVVVCIGFATEAKAESTTRIYTVEDLYAINSDMDGNYILMNDIDLSAATAKDGDWDFMGNGWEPIGSGGKYGNTEFTGTFDGNGYAIRGMRIDVSNSLPSGCDNIYIGLFANNGGTIKNLTIFKDSNISVSIKSHNVYCGSIAAYNSGAIESCDSSAHVQCDCINGKTKSSSKYYTYAGGLIGYSKGALNHCSSRGDIRCYNYGSTDFWRQGSIQGDLDTYSYQQVIGYYGGVVGFQTGNSVDFCLNTSDISVKTETRGSGSSIIKSISASVGGIYGGGDGAVNNSYNAGNIKGYDDNAENSSVVVLSGGIIGKSTSNSNSVANCYSSGMIECGTGYAISGNTDLTINDCFYLSTGAKTQDGASALTAGQFKASSCFTGFDFDNVWLMDSDSDYVQPQLKGNRQDNKDIELVELSVEPTVKEYYADSEIDPEGGEVKVYYKDGTRDTKDITKTMLRDYDMSVIGEQDVTVNYRDFTSTYKINIVERPEIENMTLISEPTKKEFVKGTEFDFTGCQVKVDYVGGKTETIDVIAKATEGGNINKLGNQTITYTLLDKSVEFTVKVIPVEIESIAVENMPTQTVFVEGKTVKTDGLAIKAIYNNGEEQLVDGYVLGELPTSIGKHQIQVSYSGCTTSFEVEIIEKSAVSISIKNQPEKTSYVIGQKLDTTGMVVEATFDNDDVLEVTDYTVGDLPETVGFGKVEIEYQGQKAYVTVSMKEKVLESISVAQMPDKVNYIQDEDFDQTGLKICANYNNGNSEEITDFTLTNKSTAKAGKKNVTVLYDGFTTTFEITVVEKTVLSITVTPPSKLSYIEGEELDKTYQDFLKMADAKKIVNDDDLLILVGKDKKKRERIISIEQLQVVCGNSMIPTATVSLKVKDEVKTETATGNGPVDAAYTAVKKIFAENNIRLQEFLIQGFNGGCDDSGRVSVQVECNKHFYQGLGVDTDIVTASVEAFVDAISKALE